jgi:UDP:flavonoid glycosyltransferase YjiC (YdhE family)
MTQRRASARRVQVPSILGDPGIQRVRTPERRFLFAVPPLTGHVAPTVAVAAELVRRGHKVAWTGHRPFLEPLLRHGSRIFSAGDDDFGTARDRWLDLRGLDAVRFLWEDFLVPLGHAMMPGVENAIARFHPDAVVADQFALAAPVAARHREIPWATSAVSPAEFTRPRAPHPAGGEELTHHNREFHHDHAQQQQHYGH